MFHSINNQQQRTQKYRVYVIEKYFKNKESANKLSRMFNEQHLNRKVLKTSSK